MCQRKIQGATNAVQADVEDLVDKAERGDRGRRYNNNMGEFSREAPGAGDVMSIDTSRENAGGRTMVSNQS